jgi:hypothetical protein
MLPTQTTPVLSLTVGLSENVLHRHAGELRMFYTYIYSRSRIERDQITMTVASLQARTKRN